MVCHVVLFRPRPHLAQAEREALVSAFEVALSNIPSVRGVRIGRRVTFGTGYEQGRPVLEFSVIIDFDDLVGLKAYLQHPAHQNLGARFTESVEQAFVYDYEMMGLEGARVLLEPSD